jgi:hypothetical protein
LTTATPAAPFASSPAVAGRMVRSTIHIVRLLKCLVAACDLSARRTARFAAGRKPAGCLVLPGSCGHALDQRRDPEIIPLNSESSPIVLNTACSGKPNVVPGCGYRRISEYLPTLFRCQNLGAGSE